MLDQISGTVNKTVEPTLNNMDEYVPKYSQFLYYFGLALSCTLLLVTVFIALGLICGICGKRTDSSYHDDCCNKGMGSRFLMW